MKILRKRIGKLIIGLVSDRGVCRTAPATLGLLNIMIPLETININNFVYILEGMAFNFQIILPDIAREQIFLKKFV